ncbi:MAG TPA: hypothetical protein VM346_02295 [Sphingomicrobium sp.]|nr:hypothetical protein [Sphingomicrobium sp.]
MKRLPGESFQSQSPSSECLARGANSALALGGIAPFVALAPKLPVGFIDCRQQAFEAGGLINRPDAIEAGAEQVQLLLGEQSHGNNAISTHAAETKQPRGGALRFGTDALS